ncbi:MAG: aromatic-ring-hydroxylating dioxygenase subunit beta [Alphaproteobacteria bacterium]
MSQTMQKDIGAVAMNRHDFEDFLYMEAGLLDDWRLKEWLALFTDDAHYLVPSTDCTDASTPADSLFYIADDRFRLGERVIRLNKKTAHAEWPRSKTRHTVHNVRIRSVEGNVYAVTCNFVVYRTKNDVTNAYIGHNEYKIVAGADGAKIREKRVILDLDSIRSVGKISIIL